ncbi:MAG: RNA-binding protein [Chloroflexota bacterium]|nr:MAG: RNA-binding protein [Chloroflexota bacterium]
MNIFVGNLASDAMEEDLQRIFEQYGKIRSVTVVRDRFSGASRGFGFVEMVSRDAGMAAISGLAGQELMGQTLRLNEARPADDSRRRGNRNRRGSW